MKNIASSCAVNSWSVGSWSLPIRNGLL